MSEIENIIDNLLTEEQNVFGVAIIGKDGILITQTENWDLTQDLANLNSIIEEAKKDGQNPGRLEVIKVEYMIIEFTPERVIATNAGKKGHIIIAPSEKGAIVAFIDPTTGPRDVLFNLQSSKIFSGAPET